MENPQDQSSAASSVAELLKRQRELNQTLVPEARKAIERLVKVCAHKTGQGYKLRALLYSLWNGQPASVLEVRCLDHALRVDLMAVLLAFGRDGFDYDQITDMFRHYNLLPWFLEAADQGGAK